MTTIGIEKSESEIHQIRNRERYEHDALTRIRKQSLDPYSRAHSILEDADFVKLVHHKYPYYPLLANLRCGAWYADPTVARRETAYFKSADGHYNAWSFNLRRPNLHLLPRIVESHGLTLIDSTRSGKRMPDSFSKTVPIWCSVVNRALQLRNRPLPENWDVELYTPPQSVSRQEHSHIMEKVDGWAESLASSSYDLPLLVKPLRPIWITPATTTFPIFDNSSPFYPIVCVSASKVIEEGSERRQGGYCYVQGSGDDHEYWSSGLTPAMFWEHKQEIMAASESDLPLILSSIVKGYEDAKLCAKADQPTPIVRVNGQLVLSAASREPTTTSGRQNVDNSVANFPYVVVKIGPKTPETCCDEGSTDKFPNVLKVTLPADKKGGERSYKNCLPQCLDFIEGHLQAGRTVCISCETGNDLSVGIAVAALQAFFDDEGKLDLTRRERKGVRVDKETLRTRLQWIIASRPTANPSRATLKRINEFFMSRPSGRHLDC